MGELSCNFQEQTLKAAVDRITQFDVTDDPVLLDVKDGMYAVHEDSLIHSNIQLYTKSQFDEKFAGQNVMSLDQLKRDYEAIDKNRIGGPVTDHFWALKHDNMEIRIKMINDDVKESQLTLTGATPSVCVPN